MKIEKISKYLFIGYLLFILAIKPVSLIAFWLLVIFGLYYAFKENINPFKIEYAKYAALLPLIYFLAMFISNILSTMPENRFNDLGRVLYLLFAPAIVVIMYKMDFSFKKLISVFKLTTVLVGSIVIVQLINNNFALHRYGGMYNVNTYGDISVFLTMFSIINIFTEKKKEFILSIISLFFGITAIILSGSRGSLLSFALLFLLFLLINFFINRQSRKKIVSVFLIVLISITTVATKTNFIKNRVEVAKNQIQRWEKGNDQTSSVATRLVMYTKGLEAFKDKPITGYGYHNAIPAISKYIKDKNIRQRYKAHWHLHNEIINTMVNAGLIGLFALLALYFVPVKIFFNNLKINYEVSTAGIILSAGVIIMGTTHVLLGYEYETSLFIIMLSYLLIKLGKTNDR